MNEFFKKPVVKILMLKGEKGDKGNTGTGTPTGGKTGQYLQKKSDADYDYVWSPITTVSWDNVSGKTNATESASGLMSADDKSKLDNLQVGGRNLYLGTKDFTGNKWLNIKNWEKESDTYNGLTIVSNKAAWGGLGQHITVNTGDVYIFSAFIKSTETAMFFPINDSDEGYALSSPGSASFDACDEFTRVKVTFKIISGGLMCPRIEVKSGTAGALKICGIKLERGNMPTDWTPAPEDAENEIKALNSVTKSFTLSASSWEDTGSWIKYDIADSLVTSNSNQEVIPNGAIISTEQFKALQRACLVGTQEQGIIHLWAYGKKPTIDIPIQVIFRGTI